LGLNQKREKKTHPSSGSGNIKPQAAKYLVPKIIKKIVFMSTPRCKTDYRFSDQNLSM